MEADAQASSEDKKPLPLPPGSMGCPLAGETLHFFIKGSALYDDKLRRLGPVYKTHLLGEPTVRVCDADHVSTMIDREPEQLTMKWPKTVTDLMGRKSLPTVVGPGHQPMRKHLDEGFTPTRLKTYVPIIKNHIRRNLEKWVERCKGDKKMKALPACEDMVAEIILEVILGCRKEDDEDGTIKDAFRDVAHNIFSIPVNIPGLGYWKGMRGRRVITDFVKSRMSKEKDESANFCVLDLMMTLPDVDDDMVKDCGIGVMLAGSSSVSGAVTCLLMTLGKNPEFFQKVKDELVDTGFNAEGMKEDYGFEAIQMLEYVQCIEKENLRVFPPVGGCYRKSENDMELDGYRIPKDWSVIYSIRDTHTTSSQNIANGDVFRPERWLEKDKDDGIAPSKFLRNSTCHYMPFGKGIRSCIGGQFARLIQHVFIIELALWYKWKVLNPNAPMVNLPITKPKDDLQMIFSKN